MLLPQSLRFDEARSCRVVTKDRSRTLPFKKRKFRPRGQALLCNAWSMTTWQLLNNHVTEFFA